MTLFRFLRYLTTKAILSGTIPHQQPPHPVDNSVYIFYPLVIQAWFTPQKTKLTTCFY